MNETEKMKTDKTLLNNNYKHILWNNKPFWIAVLLFIAWAFSYFRLVPLTEGGEVTWFSMLFLYLIEYFYGGFKGLIFAVLFGVIKFGTDYTFDILAKDHLIAEIFDYLLSYGVVGLGGFFAAPFKDRKAYLLKYNVGKRIENRCLRVGFLIAMALRFISSIINFVVFYSRAELNFAGNLREACFYCIGYVGVETLLTILLLFIPGIFTSIEYCKYVATHEYKVIAENI